MAGVTYRNVCSIFQKDQLFKHCVTDKGEYALEMKRVVESTPNLCIREAMVSEVLVGKNDNIEGVQIFVGVNFYATAIVLTTGTFMSGKNWVGRASMSDGRAGELASQGLTECLQNMGFETGRLKTGTPPRVDCRTVNFSGLEQQCGDGEEHRLLLRQIMQTAV